MPKLIRLVSDKPKAPEKRIISEFESFLKDNIILKPNSKIGLRNIKVSMDTTFLKIDSTNNTFQFKGADKYDYRTVTLTYGDYTSSTLCAHLNLKTWEQLGYNMFADGRDNVYIGFQLFWKVLNDPANGDTITFKIYRGVDTLMPNDQTKTLMQNINFQAGAGQAPGTLQRDTADQGSDSFWISKIPIMASCSYLRTQINKVSDMAIGLVQSFNLQSIVDNDLIFGINLAEDAGDYYYEIVKNYDASNVPIYEQIDLAQCTPQVDDILSLDISGGRVYYNIYRGINQADSVSLGSVAFSTFRNNEFTQLGQWYPCIAPRDGQGPPGNVLLLTQPNTIFDPNYSIDSDGNTILDFEKSNNIINVVERDLGLTYMPIPSKYINSAIAYLYFSNQDLADLLGFKNPLYSYQGITTIITAQFGPNVLNLPNNLIVELQSVKLNSYDGYTQSRRNILAVIPSISILANKIIYNTDHPLMLDIENKNEILLPSMRIRLLTRGEQDSTFEVDDAIEVVLVID